jgi:ribosomal protein S18 acetylase RimI-like enzyme
MMLTFRKALPADAERLVDFVNFAYRGETSREGWTTEADLLEGLRTNLSDIQVLISSDDALIQLAFDATELVGSVCVERQGDQASIGMFAVNPRRQGHGIGKQLLQEAEHAAQQTWGVRRLVMSVITLRHELIAFYERRGYRRTGVLKPFPVNPAMWTPKVAGRQLELLEKVLVDDAAKTRVECATS